MKIVHTSILLILVLPSIHAQTDYPIPAKTATRLFYIQHSNNTNTYVYDANMKGDVINSSQPIDEYRIVFAKNRERKPLTWIQKRFAYGMVLLESTPDQFKLRLAANKEILFYLRNERGKGPRISVTINDHQFFLDRMFVQIEEGTSGLGMRAEHVLFYGKDYQTEKPMIEKLMIE